MARGAQNKGLLLEMKDLVQQGVFVEVAPTPYILEHDLSPTGGYAFLNKLMQRHVKGIMLAKEVNAILERMAELRTSVAEYRKKEAAEQSKAEQNKRKSAPGAGAAAGAGAQGGAAGIAPISEISRAPKKEVTRIRWRFRRKPKAPAKYASKDVALESSAMPIVNVDPGPLSRYT